MATNPAVEAGIEALSGIPFVEFTTKLIDGVVEALVDSQMRQVAVYQDFFKSVSMSLADYINNTADDVDDGQILLYLQNLPPLPAAVTLPKGTPANPTSTDVTTSSALDLAPKQLNSGTATTALGAAVTLGSDVINFLNNHLKIPGVDNVVNPVPAPTQAVPTPTASSTDTSLDHLYNAVAKKIAHDRYGILEQMVKAGFARITLDYAVVETRFIFHSYEQRLDEVTRTEKFKDKEKVRNVDKSKSGFLTNIFRKQGEKMVSKNKELTVKTLKEVHRDVSGTTVDIYASVKVVLKGDYTPLSK
jgi:hypothetical protein